MSISKPWYSIFWSRRRHELWEREAEAARIQRAEFERSIERMRGMSREASAWATDVRNDSRQHEIARAELQRTREAARTGTAPRSATARRDDVWSDTAINNAALMSSLDASESPRSCSTRTSTYDSGSSSSSSSYDGGSSSSDSGSGGGSGSCD